jgi:hypothetical protein
MRYWKLEKNMLLQTLENYYKFLQTNYLISDQSIDAKLNLSNYAGVGNNCMVPNIIIL